MLSFIRRMLGGSVADATRPTVTTGGPVIYLTPATAAEMKHLAVQEKLGPDWALRVGIQPTPGAPNGWIYFQDMVEQPPQPDDAVFVSRGVTIYVDAESRPYLQGTTINFVQTSEGKGFTFDNPNTKRR